MFLFSDMEDLLAHIRRSGTVSARELGIALGVSQPSVSRRIQEAGERICKMGRTRTTRYACTRALPGLGTSLPIHRVDPAGRCAPVGRLWFLEGGRHWLTGLEVLFEGLPPFASDMRPQGYFGKSFSARYPELELPSRTIHWSEDQILLALARRGEDCVGDLILGEESLDRWFRLEPVSVGRADFPQWAVRSEKEHVGSSAGGEQPKFLTYSEGRHVLVKFASHDAGQVAGRWRDLLVCESLALEVIREAGLDAATARWFDEGSYRFLEVERFDRIGPRGRRGMLSLEALDNEYVGIGGNWTQLAPRLQECGLLPSEDSRRLRWLDVFGQLTANADRHLGNVSFLETGPERFRLAPAYDMLPMAYVPSATSAVDRPFKPDSPTATTLDVWADAAHHASRFWDRVTREEALSGDFRALARQCGERVERERARVGPLLGG